MAAEKDAIVNEFMIRKAECSKTQTVTLKEYRVFASERGDTCMLLFGHHFHPISSQYRAGCLVRKLSKALRPFKVGVSETICWPTICYEVNVQS